MKLFAIVFVLASSVLASQNAPTRDELLQTIKHIESLARDTQNQLDQEKAAHQQVQNALNAATTQNQQLQSSIDSMAQKCNSAIAAEKHLSEKLHLAKWIMSGLAVAAIGFLALKLGYPLGLYIGGPIVGMALTYIWIWL